MIKNILIPCILINLFSLLSCISSSDNHFNIVFGMDNLSMDKICSDGNVAIGGKGLILEKYNLSDKLYAKIIHSIPKSDLQKNSNIVKRSLGFDTIKQWQNTPLKGNDIVLHEYINKTLDKYNKCISKKEYLNISLSNDNLYCILHVEEYSMFRLYLVDNSNKKIYVLEETW